ncbi:MAG: hypothetical protein KZQ58_01225 [gamma proteobacterium symbiont of Bathyaustriella thionipta]|nr:hypothetical protein [gamma proteobacterium symbiont of Bathyaustriella thionipta]
MSNTADTAHIQQHLLNVVERHRQQQCADILQQAEDESQGMMAAARRRARMRVHEAVSNARDEYRHQIMLAEAHQQTRLRRARQHTEEALLKHLTARLQEALLQLWLQPVSRRRWLESLLLQAQQALISNDWLIQHAPQESAAQIADWQQQLQKNSRLDIRFEPCEEITAGWRIVADGGCVDGTIEGLQQDSNHICGLFLARVMQS